MRKILLATLLLCGITFGASWQNTKASPGNLTSMTAKNANGQYVDFVGIPSWAKKITIVLNNVSTGGNNVYSVQVGGSGGIQSNGYTSQAWAGTASTGVVTNGFILGTINGASFNMTGVVTLVNTGTNTWVCAGSLAFMNVTSVGLHSAGYVVTTGALERVRITTVGGIDTFDSGNINVFYE